MQYQGGVTKEGLKDEGFLNFANSLKNNAYFLYFQADGEFVQAIISEMSEELRQGPYYGWLKSEYEVNVIFPERIFTYKPDNNQEREKMLQYGTSLEIKKEELQRL